MEAARQHDAGFYPDDAIDGLGESLCLNIANESQGQIAFRCELFDEETALVALVSGQRQYALDPLTFRVNAAMYQTAVNNQIPLNETSIDKLDKSARGWRMIGPGTPYQFYLHGTMIGFNQTPSLGTGVSGYPIVSLAVTRANRFASLDDLLPPQLPNMDAYVYNILWRWSLRQKPDDAQRYGAAAMSALNALANFIFGRTRNKPVITPSVFRVGSS